MTEQATEKQKEGLMMKLLRWRVAVRNHLGASHRHYLGTCSGFAQAAHREHLGDDNIAVVDFGG